jgi:hypothetical protein
MFSALIETTDCVLPISTQQQGAMWQSSQLQFRISEGEQFEIEMTCCGQIFRERFGL